MHELQERAVRLLEERDQPDAARALSRCGVTVWHGTHLSGRVGAEPPKADVMISGSHELVSEIHRGKPPCCDWASAIERALRDAAAAGPGYEVRVIQWVETAPNQTPRPGTMGLGPSGGDAMA